MEYFNKDTGKVNIVIPEIKNVVNYYHLGLKEGDKLSEEYVYIGRKNNNPGLKELGESIFHNPFYLKKGKDKKENINLRIEAVDKLFKKYFWKKLMENEITKEQMKSLSGKKKVCFCGENLCHGHVIEMFIDYINRFEEEFDKKKEEYRIKKKEMKLKDTNSKQAFNQNYKIKR